MPPLFEHPEFPDDPDFSLPLPGRAAQRIALAASICLFSGLAFAVSYFVPPGSEYIEACRKNAAVDYPGEVKLISARAPGGTTAAPTQVHLYIEARDGRETVLVCDGPSGRIVRAIAVGAP
ncbi:MAG TPA: hypothetical protein VGN52_07945 [Burkholderiales bacterium]|jgi:hypothetical protein